MFPNKDTHPVVHAHETAMCLLKEQDYVTHIQLLMHWLRVDESTDTLLTFPNLNINGEPVPSQTQPPAQLPTQPPTQQHSNFARLQHGFLTNTEPHPLLYHYTHLTNIKPRNAHNLPLVGVHLRDAKLRSPS